MISTEISDYYRDALQLVNYIYDFIYILDDPKNYPINRKNHLSTQWILMEMFINKIKE